MKKPHHLANLQAPADDSPLNRGSGKGYQVSSNGTLRVELMNGNALEIRSKGANLPSPTVEQGEITPGSLLGQVRWEDLKIGHVIGEGIQGSVRKVKHAQTGEFYALKTINLSGQGVINKRTLQTELSRVAAATHPNVVTSNDAFFVDGKLRLLMEYMNLGTLSSVAKQVGPMPTEIVGVVCHQVLLGLEHLHGTGIVHRDIKPSNLLVNTLGEVKIADFGVSTILVQQAQALTQVGSTAYMSPERIRGEFHDSSSDIWSVGVTCAECALGVFPLFIEDVDFSENNKGNPFTQRVNMFDLSATIAEGNAKVCFDVLIPAIIRVYPSRSPPDVSNTVIDFVAQCMHQVPTERPSCHTLLTTHPLIVTDAAYVDKKLNFRHWLKERGVPRHHDKGSNPDNNSFAESSK